MLMLRLQRVGRKNDPSFRLVVVQKEKGPRSGAFLEIVGSYDARQNRIQLKEDRIKHWLSKGVQPSTTVHNILVKSKIIAGPKVAVHKKSKNSKNPEKPAEQTKI